VIYVHETNPKKAESVSARQHLSLRFTKAETTDGMVHHRDGVERHGSLPCVVLSTENFNDSQANGIIVVPLISGINVDLAKFKQIPSTWVRFFFQGETGICLSRTSALHRSESVQGQNR